MAKVFLLIDENSNITLKPELSAGDKAGMDQGEFDQVFSLESDGPVTVREVFAEAADADTYDVTETEIELEAA